MSKQAFSLALKLVKMHADKVPDEWLEKIPYFRPQAPQGQQQQQRQQQRRRPRQTNQRRRHSTAGSRQDSDSDGDGDRSSSRSRRRHRHPDNGRKSARRSSDKGPTSGGGETGTAPLAADMRGRKRGRDPPDQDQKDAPPNPRRPPALAPSSPLPGYHDGPAPSFLAPFAAAAAAAPRSLDPASSSISPRTHLAHMTSPPPHGQEYYPPPPPQGDEYPRQRYNPANYQPSDYSAPPRNETLALQGPRSTYSDDRYGRAASADPGGRYSQYDSYDGRYDDDDRRDRRSHRSKSRSRRSGSRSTERSRFSKLEEHFDVSQKGLGAGALGAIAGGLIAHKFGKTPLATGAGVVLGGLGANAWEAHSRHKHDRDHYREKEKMLAYDGRSRSIEPDSRPRRGIEYYDNEEPRRGRYDDEYSDEEYDEERRRRRDSRRRRRSEAREYD